MESITLKWAYLHRDLLDTVDFNLKEQSSNRGEAGIVTDGEETLSGAVVG